MGARDIDDAVEAARRVLAAPSSPNTAQTTPRQDAELKPCPHCGVQPFDVHLSGSAWFVGANHKPDCFLTGFMQTEAEARAAWNTRSSGDVAWSEVAQLATGYAETFPEGPCRNAFHDFAELATAKANNQPLQDLEAAMFYAMTGKR